MAMIEPLYALRDVDVPTGARTRVRARLEEQLARRARAPHRHIARYAFATAVIAIVVAFVALPRQAHHAVVVPDGTHVDFELAKGRSSVYGPAHVVIDSDGLSLASGRVDAEGKLRVRGPACDVIVDGTAEVSVKDSQLTVRVFAGSVEIVPPAMTCERIDLTPPAKAPASKRTQVDTTTMTPTMTPTVPAIVEPATPAIVEPATPAIVEPATPTPTPTAAPRTAARDKTKHVAAQSAESSAEAAPSPAPIKAAPPRTPAEVAPPRMPAAPPRMPAAPPRMPKEAAPPRAPVEAAPPPMRVEAAPPRAPVEAAPPRAPVEAAPPPPATVTPKPVASEELADALAEYRAATALETTDPSAAVRAWRSWRARRSNTALAHGADLRLLALLHSLHRDVEAAELAREFLQRYPHSPRRADVERLIARPQ
jgi:hypothetical protein